MEHLEIPSEHEHQGHTPLKPHQGQHRTANQELIEQALVVSWVSHQKIVCDALNCWQI
jgi:hypothetical protein